MKNGRKRRKGKEKMEGNIKATGEILPELRGRIGKEEKEGETEGGKYEKEGEGGKEKE